MGNFREFIESVAIITSVLSVLVAYACIKVGGDYDRMVQRTVQRDKDSQYKQ